MLRRQIAGLSVATLAVLTLFCAFSVGIAGPQEKTKTPPHAGEAAKEKAKDVPHPPNLEAEKRDAQIAKMVDAYDLKPHPLSSIPDDPPPHEGAMISLPDIVEPADLVMIEVLEALPGRPISGERLVRPDGKISIGFYGEVYVRGLTLEQVKVAIVKRLRKFLTDEGLGLAVQGFEAESVRSPFPELPAGAGPFDLDDKPKEKIKPRASTSRTPRIPNNRGIRSAARRSKRVPVPRSSRRPRVVRVSTQDQEQQAPAPNAIMVPVGPQGKLTITIELHGLNAPAAQKAQPVPVPQEVPDAMGADEGTWTIVPPDQSDRIFVDITAYNSQSYYILGDVMVPGKLPCTGNETVLDALQYAGGLMSTAEPKDIRLVRPGRGGKPAKVYKIDLAAIQEKGDVTANFQIFPNDRLIVGRNEVVKKTAEIDRLAAPIQSAASSIQNMANMLRAVQLADQANSAAILKELVDFWAKEVSRKGDLKFDENTLREALLQKLKPAATPAKK